MKRKLLVALICSLVVFTLSPFMVAAKQVEKDKHKLFTADAYIIQDVTTAIPQTDDYIHYKTLGEKLNGSITDCNWALLVDAEINMVNDSYYTMIPVDETYTTFSMTGMSYSTITITTEDSEGSVTFKAAGTMNGTYPLPGVGAKMKVLPRSINAQGTLRYIDPKQLVAFFYWTEEGGFGDGTITGHYKDIDKNKNH